MLWLLKSRQHYIQVYYAITEPIPTENNIGLWHQTPILIIRIVRSVGDLGFPSSTWKLQYCFPEGSQTIFEVVCAYVYDPIFYHKS